MKGANLKKRRWGLALLAIAVLTGTALPARADTWDGVTSTIPSKQNDGLYWIESAAQFVGFRDWINGTPVQGEAAPGDAKDATYELKANIDLKSAEWTPIGINETNYFSGTFKGNKHKVSNFKIVSDTYSCQYAGLFGYLTGDIISLGVTDFVISVDCSEKDVYAGGLAGCQNGGSIADSCATGSIRVFSRSYDKNTFKEALINS
jgi:hypothetical protein